ncbi:hypothetical protein ACKKBG_A34585 [Auxenochlorella protothecoides x Auxenochlorella symbiontica]
MEGRGMEIPGSDPRQSVSKEEALEACAAEHYRLVTCFRQCSLWESFVGCCLPENQAFWQCYTTKRGKNEVTGPVQWLNTQFSGPGAKSKGEKAES